MEPCALLSRAHGPRRGFHTVKHWVIRREGFRALPSSRPRHPTQRFPHHGPLTCRLPCSCPHGCRNKTVGIPPLRTWDLQAPCVQQLPCSRGRRFDPIANTVSAAIETPGTFCSDKILKLQSPGQVQSGKKGLLGGESRHQLLLCRYVAGSRCGYRGRWLVVSTCRTSGCYGGVVEIVTTCFVRHFFVWSWDGVLILFRDRPRHLIAARLCVSWVHFVLCLLPSGLPLISSFDGNLTCYGIQFIHVLGAQGYVIGCGVCQQFAIDHPELTAMNAGSYARFTINAANLES